MTLRRARERRVIGGVASEMRERQSRQVAPVPVIHLFTCVVSYSVSIASFSFSLFVSLDI